MPLLGLLLLQQVVPALQTVWWSFQNVTPIAGDTEWVGTANYRMAAEILITRTDPLSGVMFGLLPGLLGFAAGFGAGRLSGRSEGGWRAVGLAQIGVVGALIAPLSMAIALRAVLAAQIPAPLHGLIHWAAAALAVGGIVGATLSPEARTGRALGVGLLLAAVAGGALGLQHAQRLVPFDPPWGFTIFEASFQRLHLGLGSALSVLLLVVLMPAGVVVTLLLLRSGWRLRIEPRDTAASPSSGLGALTGGALLLIAAILLSLPWLQHTTASIPPNVPIEPGRALALTWGLGTGEVLISLAIAALAGAGIGYVRPLGDRSLPILLGFLSPWLLVGVAPLVTAHYLARYETGTVGTILGAVYPQLVVVPLVFLAAYLGDAARAASGAGRGGAWGTVLATTAFAGLNLMVLRSEHLLWSLVTGAGPLRDAAASAFALMTTAGGNVDGDAGIALLKPIAGIAVLAVLLAGCAIGLNRLRIVEVWRR